MQTDNTIRWTTLAFYAGGTAKLALSDLAN